ncbi:MAG TPA: serine/threonine-protein kinase, partial [Roseiflexaceae bacterium]
MAEGAQQFGKYRILDELGAGGFATVYRAADTTLDREVALKILHPPLLADRTFVQRFRQEARTLAALRHPQIITVYEVGEVDGRVFIAMDLAHGLSLAKSIAKRGRIPWAEALALLRPVCEALDYAHGQRVVHRDLKPANVLLDTQRGALLTDFGFAR